jgi:hypothetical protein
VASGEDGQLKPYRSCSNQYRVPGLCFDAFSQREADSVSLANAIGRLHPLGLAQFRDFTGGEAEFGQNFT